VNAAKTAYSEQSIAINSYATTLEGLEKDVNNFPKSILSLLMNKKTIGNDKNAFREFLEAVGFSEDAIEEAVTAFEKEITTNGQDFSNKTNL